MGKLLLALKLKLPEKEANLLIEEFWRLNPELREFRDKLKYQDEVKTPLYGRILRLDSPHKRVNWVIQGSCAELLWEALRYLDTKEKEVKVLPHFHDELVLKCLKCKDHEENKVCSPIIRLKGEIEDLYPFTWPGTVIKVFKLEVK